MTRKYVDVKDLRAQALIVGEQVQRLVDHRSMISTNSELQRCRRRIRHLNGVWELLHSILDDVISGRPCTLYPVRRRR